MFHVRAGSAFIYIYIYIRSRSVQLPMKQILVYTVLNLRIRFELFPSLKLAIRNDLNIRIGNATIKEDRQIESNSVSLYVVSVVFLHVLEKGKYA